ncbi:MAG TPA: putative toxin-antitoxin system toxin component, PIN family [Solirubrobacteraceae bacterium]|nr:putative toxin-antitoxin system toxin component, PIN family [Solirubrobacteraceae bacterium]
MADVNVLVSAARSPNGLCGGLLDAATAGRWIPVVSVMLFQELEEVLARPKFRDVLGQEATDRFLADLIAIAEWAQDPTAAATSATRDPDDEYLLALSRSAKVDVLVSGDRDLTDLLETTPPIETPAQFSLRLLSYPERIVRLADTDLDVFPLCLGGNVFGWSIDEQRSFAVLDAYVQAGGNFIDTADIYGRRGAGGMGESERIIGRWIAARGNREQLVIATKVGMSPELPGLSRATIRSSIEGSLERLGIDTVDLYYAHQDDPDTPLEETLGAFGELVDEGKIRHAAASNYSAERLREAVRIGAGAGMASYVALQPHYNLVERGEYEGDLQDVCAQAGLACIPYFGLARGFLSGKYRRDGAQIDSPRAAGVREAYFNERGFAVLDALDEVAAAHDAPVASVALAWLLAQPMVLAPIASATSPEQLAELVACVDLELAPAELARLGTAGA